MSSLVELQQLASQAWIWRQALDAVIDCGYQVQHFEELTHKHFVEQSPLGLLKDHLIQADSRSNSDSWNRHLFKYINTVKILFNHINTIQRAIKKIIRQHSTNI